MISNNLKYGPPQHWVIPNNNLIIFPTFLIVDFGCKTVLFNNSHFMLNWPWTCSSHQSILAYYVLVPIYTSGQRESASQSKVSCPRTIQHIMTLASSGTQTLLIQSPTHIFNHQAIHTSHLMNLIDCFELREINWNYWKKINFR